MYLHPNIQINEKCLSLPIDLAIDILNLFITCFLRYIYSKAVCFIYMETHALAKRLN